MARTKEFNESEVLNKAIKLFWHKGYSATSMQDLVDGLGISRSSLYDTFGDKHTLYVRALESYQKAGAQSLLKIVKDAASAKLAVKQLLELTTDELTSDCQQKGCFMVNAEVEVGPHDADVSEMVKQNDKQIANAFYQAIKKGQQCGEIGAAKDARALARFIFNTFKGMRVTAKSITDKTVFEDIIKITVSVLD